MKDMSVVNVGVLSKHDVFFFKDSYYVVLDDEFYAGEYSYVVALYLGSDLDYNDWRIVTVCILAPTTRVLFGGDFYEG